MVESGSLGEGLSEEEQPSSMETNVVVNRPNMKRNKDKAEEDCLLTN